jgi:tRNA threonylcarbamoyladenosine modification (KEOPS) complex  Pcc1 subunit
MKEIICTTQKELDVAVKENGVIVIIQNTTTEVYISDNSTVRAYDNSTVRASGNSTVTASGNSTVTASGNSTVRAYDNSTVRAYDNSTVRAYGNSTVRASGNSTVTAYDNSTVRASGNSTVTAYGNSVSIEAFMLAVVIMIGCVCKIKKSKTVQVIKNKIAQHDKKSFIQIHKENIIDKDTIKLFKSVRKDNRKDFHSNTIKYEGEVLCPDFNPSNEIECGQGLHLSPYPELALDYSPNGLVLECSVKLKDFVVHQENITKVRCKRVTVLGEYKKQ